MGENLKTLTQTQSKGKSLYLRGALDNPNVDFVFLCKITDHLSRAASHLSEGVLVNLTNATLMRRDAVLEALRPGARRDTGYRSAIANKLSNSLVKISKNEGLTNLLHRFHRDKPKGRRSTWVVILGSGYTGPPSKLVQLLVTGWRAMSTKKTSTLSKLPTGHTVVIQQ